MKLTEVRKQLEAGAFAEQFEMLYGNQTEQLTRQKQRYLKLVDLFEKQFPGREEVHLYSAPGRTEIGGNHTDHQHGCVLAAAVNLDVIAVVAFHDEGVIRLKSTGYPMDTIDLSNLEVRPQEKGKAAALIRGVAASFAKLGVKIGGFDAYTTSDVLSGSGLSSSAAFEVLVGTIIDQYYNGGKAGAVEIAKFGQYAENVYFGKASGLMDQMVSSVGGFVCIDFNDPANPGIVKHEFDFAKAGYCLCVTDTKGSHAGLTDDYVAIPAEMKSVAAVFGKEYLRDVDEQAFWNSIPQLHGKCSDRAIMRAAHFFGENRRAVEEAEALHAGDLERFFAVFKESAASSAELLQNLYAPHKPEEQAIPLAIWASKRCLGSDAAVRVHGGGFAGTIQAFVPVEKQQQYREAMESLFGKGSCYLLRIRPVGGIELKD